MDEWQPGKNLTSLFQFLCDIKFEGIHEFTIKKPTFSVYQTFLYLLQTLRKLQNTSWVLWVLHLLLSILSFLHYIQCNKKVKGTPKSVIKNLHFCLLNFFIPLTHFEWNTKNSYGINLTSRFKFYLIVNLKVFLSQSLVNLHFSFKKNFVPLTYFE